MKKWCILLLPLLLCGCHSQPETPNPTVPTQPEKTVLRQVMTESEWVSIPYETIYCQDPSLPVGVEEVVFPGEQGQKELSLQVTYVDGKKERMELLSACKLSEPTPQIVAVGTGTESGERQFPLVGDGVLVTAQGQCLYFSHMDTYNATAYTAWVADTKDTTACGTKARVGAVAVDPKVIPYFTKMYIVSQDGVFDYGVSSAEDCGGAVKGKIIDLYFDTLQECYAFGRRDVTVYFLVDQPVLS